MTWADFELNTALERDVLLRALPLAATAGPEKSAITIDLTANTVGVSFSSHGTGRVASSKCIDLLRIRPLLVGAAWKVLDLLLETALDLDGQNPDVKRGWSIKKKVHHAQVLTGKPTALSPAAWEALMTMYAKHEELRHSLVHRKVSTDLSGALVGIDRAGAPLRTVTAAEQEALGRSALRAAELVTAQALDDRVEADLNRQLGYLRGIHAVTLPAVTLLDSLPTIGVIIDPDPTTPGHYLLNVLALRLHARRSFPGLTHADLIVQLRDRPGYELHGRLEAAPDRDVPIDPAAPPTWLT